MIAVHVLRLELGLISISQIITGLTGVLQGYPQAAISRHFARENHRGFLEDARVAILYKLYGNGRQRESFWQYKLDTFVPRGLTIRKVYCCS